MKTFGTLSDLAQLSATESRPQERKTGYDGKPQRISVTADSRRRAGKTVTLASGFQSKPDELERLAGKLKKLCGAGGRVLDNEIEIQGDHTQAVKNFLEKEGYAVK